MGNFLLQFGSLSSVLKSYGQQLKAPAAMVRLRLYETLTLLPANSMESSYTHLLRMLVSEFTLTENPANTTNSLLRELCHSDDSIILGTWLQETDHKTIEDQVNISTNTQLYYVQESFILRNSMIWLDRDHLISIPIEIPTQQKSSVFHTLNVKSLTNDQLS